MRSIHSVEEKQKVIFQIGDVVMLKSGGPPMTIDVVSNHMVYVVWMDNDELVRMGSFSKHVLEPCTSIDEIDVEDDNID